MLFGVLEGPVSCRRIFVRFHNKSGKTNKFQRRSLTMLRRYQDRLIFLLLISLSMVLCEASSAAALSVKLVVNPIRTEVSAGSDRIVLTTRASGTRLTFKWELRGPGKLEEKGLAAFYFPPDAIEKVSELATITVTVTDDTGQETKETVTFKILTPTPSPVPTPTITTGMSKGTRVVLGIGAVALLGGGIALVFKGFLKNRSVHLRNKPLMVSAEKAQKLFGLDRNWRLRKYLKNDFEDKGDVVVDYATGLVWQKSGSDERLTYKAAQTYIEKLNRQRFVGYNDWRLPTIEELMSLLEPKTKSHGLYINPLFDAKQTWCWSADRCSAVSAWLLHFYSGLVNWYSFNDSYYVRCVRSGQ